MYGKKTDGGGLSGTLKKITLMTGMDYRKILANVPSDRKVTIWTYDLRSTQGIAFYRDCLGHLQNCELIVNKIDETLKKNFETELPNVTLKSKPQTHAKFVLIEPNIVYVASQNFGDNPDWFQHAACIQDEDVYKFYFDDSARHANTDLINNIRNSGSQVVYTTTAMEKPNAGKYVPDYNGISLDLVESKLASTVNWNQKFNGDRGRNIILCTQTLPDLDYCKTIVKKLLKQGNRVCFIANHASIGKLNELKQECEEIAFETFSNFHAKMALVSPTGTKPGGTVWLSSQNFGSSGWFEHMIKLKHAKAYEYYLGKLEEFVGHKIWFSQGE